MNTPETTGTPDSAAARKPRSGYLWWVVWGLVAVALGWTLIRSYDDYRNEVPVSRVPVVGENGISVREVGSCDDALPPGGRSKVQQVSRDQDSLVVQVLANASCGRRRVVSPSAELAGNSVTLAWAWEVIGVPAACICTHHLEFRVPGVPPGEVSVRTAPPAH